MQQDVVKSPNDKNLYRVLTLDNGLKVLLVSDQNYKEANHESEDDASTDGYVTSEEETTDAAQDSDNNTEHENKTKGERTNLAAAALCINVGSLSDPDDLPGLAHFLEHMVFMGSEKYPVENAYSSFISRNGGSDNAWTDFERTAFVMDVVPKQFKKALDIFANCFISPLLKPESMDRELEAVDSEFSLLVPNDSERRFHVLQSTAKKEHPIAKFMCGNIKSLKEVPAEKNIDVNEALHRFYKSHYSAEHMTLAVQSIETLDTLEEWVREIFSMIPNFNVPAPCFDDLLNPYDMEKFNKLYKVVPVKDVHEIKLSWALPPLIKHYRSKPMRYLGSVVGDEGKGSILAYLRKKFLAVALSAGSYDSGCDMNSTCTMFSISINLTEMGLEKLNDVLLIIFQYLKMLKKEGPQQYLFDEMQLIAATDFQFQEQEESYNYVEKLAADMQLYKQEEYITGSKLIFEFDEKLIQDLLDEIDISNVNITILSSTYSETMCNKEECWTKCKYSCEDIPQEWIDLYNDAEIVPHLHLPEPNRFIATDFNLKNTTSSNAYPYKILESDQGQLWFKEDIEFKVPKACIYFHICTPAVFSSALNNTMVDLFTKILLQVLCEKVYPAEVASVYSSVMVTAEGLALCFWGFSHKIPELIDIILEQLINFEVEEELFDAMKQKLKLKYYNLLLKPNKLSKILESSINSKPFWSPLEKKGLLETITLEMLMDYVKTLLSSGFVKGLAQGNITAKDAIEMYDTVVSKLGLSPLAAEDIPRLSSYIIPCGDTFCQVASFNKHNSNSIVTNYYQFGPRSFELYCNTELLLDFMNEPCFDILRTREQLGYSVYSMKRTSWNSIGFVISVYNQSNKFSCSYVDQRIEEFLKNFVLEMIDMSEEKYQTQLNSLIEHKKQVFMNLKEECDFNWSLMQVHVYAFNLKQRQINYLEKLKLEDFKDWVKQVLPSDLNGRKKISFQVLGPDDVELKNGLMVSEVDGVSSSKCDITALHFLPGCEGSSATHISDLDAFTNSLQLYPKYADE